jgi:hypothetical protein
MERLLAEMEEEHGPLPPRTTEDEERTRAFLAWLDERAEEHAAARKGR